MKQSPHDHDTITCDLLNLNLKFVYIILSLKQMLLKHTVQDKYKLLQVLFLYHKANVSYGCIRICVGCSLLSYFLCLHSAQSYKPQ